MLALIERYTNLGGHPYVRRIASVIDCTPRQRSRFACIGPDTIDDASSLLQTPFDLPPELLARVISHLPEDDGLRFVNSHVQLLKAGQRYAEIIRSLPNGTLRTYLLMRFVVKPTTQSERIFEHLYPAAANAAPRANVLLREAIDDVSRYDDRQLRVLEKVATQANGDERLIAKLASSAMSLPDEQRLPFFCKQLETLSDPYCIAKTVATAVQFDLSFVKEIVPKLLAVPGGNPPIPRALAAAFVKSISFTSHELNLTIEATEDTEALCLLTKQIGRFPDDLNEQIFIKISDRNDASELTSALAERLDHVARADCANCVSIIRRRSGHADPAVNIVLVSQIKRLDLAAERMELFGALRTALTTDDERKALAEACTQLAPELRDAELRFLAQGTESESVHSIIVNQLRLSGESEAQIELYFDLLRSSESEAVLKRLNDAFEKLPKVRQPEAFNLLAAKPPYRSVMSQLAKNLEKLKGDDYRRAFRALREAPGFVEVLVALASQLPRLWRQSDYSNAARGAEYQEVYREIRGIRAWGRAEHVDEILLRAMPIHEPAIPAAYPGEHRETALRHCEMFLPAVSSEVRTRLAELRSKYNQWTT